MEVEHPRVEPEDCDCWKCEGEQHNEHGVLLNNMEYHTYGTECGDCGTERTQYRDLGTKGRFVCPECN